MPLTLRSSAFGSHAPIPRRYTTDGEDLSPPLEWTEIPEGTRSLALIVEDPDAPDPANPQRTFVHWIVYDLDASLPGLEEGSSAHLPAGAQHGTNDWGRADWGGPCPPIGEHRYIFRLYALDTRMMLRHPTKARLLEAMDRHMLASAELVGTYRRAE